MPRGRISPDHAPCTNCGGQVKRYESHGWCRACRTRWTNAGRPDSGPPPPRPSPIGRPMSAAVRARISERIHESYEDRLEQFRKLDGALDARSVREDARLTDRQIAERMRVTRRTVWRYRAAERAAGRGWWKNRPR